MTTPSGTSDRRVARLVLPIAVASLLLVTGLAPKANAASVLEVEDLSVSISGATATATATVSSTPGVTATRAGICVRSSSGAVVDFPSSTNTVITEDGITLTGVRTFTPGTYQYWACVLSADTWSRAGNVSSFTVGGATSSLSTAAMPVGDLPGWTQTFAEDFTTDLERGSWPGAYGDRWMSYDGFTDTSKKGDYDQDIISAHDGVLDLYLHTEDGRPRGAAPVPLVDGEWGGQTYGRFSVRLKADELPGYGTGFLLWNDSGDWADGEIDFPESGLDDVVKGYNHCPGNPAENCYVVNTDTEYSDWHTYTVDWTPARLSYLVDGVVVGSTTSNIPSKPLHWVMQVATTGVTPDPATAGHLLIDWATIYRYTP